MIQNKLAISALWFRDLDYRSVLDCNYWFLYYDYRVRGVRRVSAKGTSKIFSGQLPYTQREVASNLDILDSIITGRIRISDLGSKVEEVAEFIKRTKTISL